MAIQEQAAPEFKGGEIVKFTGYAEPLPPGQEPLLKLGEMLEVQSINDDGGLTCVVLDEGGKQIAGRQGETLFSDEVEVVDLPTKKAAKPKSKAKGKNTSDKADVAEAAEVKAQTKPAKKAAKKAKPASVKAAKSKKASQNRAAVKVTKAAKRAAKQTDIEDAVDAVEGRTGIEDGVAVEVNAKAATKTKMSIKHDAGVLKLIQEKGALKAAKELVVEEEQADFMLGGVLAEIAAKELHVEAGYEEGRKGLNEYVETELKINYRKARYLINTYEVFRDPRLVKKLTATMRKQLGWTKARLLAAMGADQLVEHWDEVWGFATGNSRAGLETFIKGRFERVRSDGDAERVRITRMSFRLVGDAALTVERAINQAYDLVGEQDPNKALEYICGEWLNLTEVGR